MDGPSPETPQAWNSSLLPSLQVRQAGPGKGPGCVSATQLAAGSPHSRRKPLMGLQLGTPLQEQNHKHVSCWVIMLNHCQELKPATDSFLLLQTLAKTDTLSLLFKLL